MLNGGKIAAGLPQEFIDELDMGKVDAIREGSLMCGTRGSIVGLCIEAYKSQEPSRVYETTLDEVRSARA